MMSQINTPFHRYKTCCQYYSIWDATWEENSFDNFLLANGKRYIDSDLDSERSKKGLFNFNFNFSTPCMNFRVLVLVFYRSEGAKKDDLFFVTINQNV